MLWYSWSGQRWSNLLQCSAPCYSLLTFTDNTALPVFLYFDTCLVDVSLHRIIIYIHFPLIYVICLALTHITRSYRSMNGWQRRAFSFSTHTHTHTRTHTHTHTHTHTQKRAWGLNEDTNTWTALRVTSWPFHSFIWVKLSSYHIHTEM